MFKRQWLAIALLCSAILFYVIRIQYSMGWWGDESYQIATAWRYILGDIPFLQSWDMNFSSSLLYVPFTWLYVKLFGSLDGIVIAYRIYFVVMHFAMGWMVFRILRKHVSGTIALLAGFIVTCTLTYFACMPGYGCDWKWLALASLYRFDTLSAVSITKKDAIRSGSISAILAAMSILGNPTLIVAGFLLVLSSFVAEKKRFNSLISSQSMLIVLTGIGLSYYSFLRIWVGPGLIAGVLDTLGSEDHTFSIFGYFQALWIMRVPLIAMLGPALIGLLLSRFTKSNAAVYGTVWSLGIIIVGLLLLRHAPYPVYETQILLMGFSISTILAYLFVRQPSRGSEIGLDHEELPYLILIAGSLGGITGMFLGSNGGVLSASQNYVPLFVMALILVGQRTVNSDLMRKTMLVALGALLVLGVGSSLVLSPDDVPLWQATKRMTCGPYKGILTAPERAVEHDAIRDAVKAAVPDSAEHIIFFEMYCTGYLFGDQRPGTYYTWSTGVDSMRLARYLQDQGIQPEAIVATRYHTEGASAGISLTRTGEFAVPNIIDMSQYHIAVENEYCRVYLLTRQN